MTCEEIALYRRWVDLETRGEATCRTHARRTGNADLQAKWDLLADLERTTKEALIRALRAQDVAVTESEAMRREGERRGEQSAPEDWLDVMTALRPRILHYLEELRGFGSESARERPALTVRLREHEEAWLAFVDRELAGDAKSSIEPIQAHLAKWAGRGEEATADSR